MTTGDRYRSNQGPSNCDEVGCRRGGHLDRTVGDRFRRAYADAGGEERLGCPREDDPSGYVGPWGPGLRQDLRGGSEGQARIMALALDGTYGEAVVMSGQWCRDYTDGSGLGGNSAPVMGYPVSAPETIGSSAVVRLAGGEAGPGLMASGPDGTMFWIIGVAGRYWLQTGGSDGPLGRPTAWPEQHTGGTFLQRFEHDVVMVERRGDVWSSVAVPSGHGPLDARLLRLIKGLDLELPGRVDDPFTVRGWTDVREKLRDAEREIERGRYQDAATDLGTAMQLAFAQAGYHERVLGKQLVLAKRAGLFTDLNSKLGPAVESFTEWLSAFRNQRSDAHPSSSPPSRSDTVLALRLATSVAGWLADVTGDARGRSL